MGKLFSVDWTGYPLPVNDLSFVLDPLLVRPAMRAVATHLHEKVLPRRFTAAGAAALGFRPPNKRYLQFKLAVYKHADPLVLTGRTRRRIAEAKGVNIIERRFENPFASEFGAPARIDMEVTVKAPSYILTRRPKSGPSMLDLFKNLTASELAELQRVFEQEYAAQDHAGASDFLKFYAGAAQGGGLLGPALFRSAREFLIRLGDDAALFS